MNRLILAGDVGGTKTELGLFHHDGERLDLVRTQRFVSCAHGGMGEMVRAFLRPDDESPAAAAFGVAGPVRGGVGDITNVPWDVDGARLATELEIPRVGVINDLVAMAWGAISLPPDRFVALNEGQSDLAGNGAVIGAGTGLGEAVLIRQDAGWLIAPSEGGHASFSPQNALEAELLEWLRPRVVDWSLGHVSFERVLSGPGLHNIYLFLRETGRGVEEPWLTARLAAEAPPKVIGEAGIAGASSLCERALAMFAAIYGNAAGNLALTALATGGLWLGGGIAPKILPALQKPLFLDAFLGKGRLQGVLERIPVRVMMEPQAPLFGAAHYAAIL